MNSRIVVGPKPFDTQAEYNWLAGDDQDGAVVTFHGKVRHYNLGDDVSKLALEHYPGMTEKALRDIIEQARQRWTLNRVTIIHRVGELGAGEDIVMVGVSSAHRNNAFAAAEFMMDILKTQAPFWKRESTPDGDRWLGARDSDHQAVKRWTP